MDSKEIIDQRIVLIDDSELDNFITRSVILQTGHRGKITDFLSAGKALKFLSSISEEIGFIPEIIFLDLSMPEMDGLQFLKEFANLPSSIRLKSKIVILSSSIYEEDISRAGESENVIKFLSKPLTRAKFLEVQSLRDKNKSDIKYFDPKRL